VVSISISVSFLLVPDGHTAATLRLPEVILHGCIPVIISNRVELPWAEWIQWEQVAIFLSEEQIPDLMKVLKSIPDGEVDSMQQNVEAISAFMDFYHDEFMAALHFSLLYRRDGLGADSVAHKLGGRPCYAVRALQLFASNFYRRRISNFEPPAAEQLAAMQTEADCARFMQKMAGKYAQRGANTYANVRPFDLSESSLSGSARSTKDPVSGAFNA